MTYFFINSSFTMKLKLRTFNLLKSFFRLSFSKAKFSLKIRLFIYAFVFIFMLSDLLLLNSYIFNNIDFNVKDLISHMIPEGQATSGTDIPTDPARLWPAGVPQSLATVGAGLAVFNTLVKVGACNPRLRVLASLGAAGVTASTITYHSSIEHSIGFNRFMFGITESAHTGRWPSIDQILSNRVEQNKLDEFVAKAMQKADPNQVSSTIEEVTQKIGPVNNYTPDSTDNLTDQLMDTFFRVVTTVLKPEHVEGYFDDLVGQQIIIQIILLLMVISILLLFLFLLLNILFILYKDAILSKVENKFIKLYLKYQVIMSRLALIYTPLLIIFGLFVLIHGFSFMITHPIPYGSLNIDLHTYVSSKN